MLSLKIIFSVVLIPTLIIAKRLFLTPQICLYLPSTKCPDHKCFFFEGEKLSFETCTETKQLPFDKPLQLDLYKCTFDFRRTKCDSDLCFIAEGVPFTFKQLNE